jgi:ribosomal-protein-alanine N-acetyltransferase
VRLRGARVLLRPPAPLDVTPLVSFSRRNRVHLGPWNPAPTPETDTTSVTGASRVVANQRSAFREGRGYTFLVMLQQPTGRPRLIGRVSLNNVVRGAFWNAYLGYFLDGAMQGQGLTGEAIELVLGFAFERVGLHRVQAAIMPRNARSLRVVEKLGFRREGFAERYLQIAGKWEDHVLFAMTAEEHLSRQAQA